MGEFEEAFSAVERVASSTSKSATELAKLSKKLETAAKVGNIAAVKRYQTELDKMMDAVRQGVANAMDAWPFREEEEEQYLKEGYFAELCTTAATKGLRTFTEGDRLIAHPSIVRTVPNSRQVRIDKKKTSNLRPSFLADMLLKNQKKPPRFQAGSFLQALFETYELVKDGQVLPPHDGRLGQVVALENIYKAFTSPPGASREYDRTDFARDLYYLDLSGPRQTRSGMRVDFPAAAGTRGTHGVFYFADPEGRTFSYYGIRFSRTE